MDYTEEKNTLNSRTYGFSVKAPETLSDPIQNALRNVPASPERQRSIAAGPSATAPAADNDDKSQQLVVAAAPPTRAIEIVGGRSRFVDDEDVESIVSAWLDPEKDPSDIKLIDISLNKISNRGMVQLVRAIGERPGQLKDFDVDSNNLTDESLKAIVQHLVNNDRVVIERMDLSTNNFTDLGVAEFVNALRERKSKLPLRTLLLRQCNLTNTALRAICEWLSDAECPLTSLHISGNDFTELDGIKYVADAIRANKKLIDFNVSNCFDYVARWEPIVDAVADGNTTLQKFNIAVMGKKHEAIVPLDAVLTKNRRDANATVSEITRLKEQHAKEIDNLKAKFANREKQLEGRIHKLLSELERIQGADTDKKMNTFDDEY